jgi:hypothetical protein
VKKSTSNNLSMKKVRRSPTSAGLRGSPGLRKTVKNLPLGNQVGSISSNSMDSETPGTNKSGVVTR